MTKTQAIIAGLKASGHTEVTAQHRTKKYRVFTSQEPGKFCYVGKAGALRKGSTVTDSISIDPTPLIRLARQMAKLRIDIETERR